MARRGREAEALACYQDLIQRYGESTVPEVQTLVAAVFSLKANLQLSIHDPHRTEQDQQNALNTYNQFLDRYQDRPIPAELQDTIQAALINSAKLLIRFDQPELALTRIQQVLSTLSDTDPKYPIMKFLQWLAEGGSWQGIWQSLEALAPETEFEWGWTEIQQIIAKLPAERRVVAEQWLAFFQGQLSRGELQQRLFS